MSFKPGEFSFETLAIHAGQEPETTTGAVVVPIFQTSTYAQESLGNPRQGYDYSRADNPTRKAYEDCIAALENGRYGTAYSSGMGAINNCMYLLKSGDEVIVGDDVYGGTYRFFTKVMDGFGITARFVDTSDLQAVEQAFTPQTRMIWVETPTNPLLKIADLKALSGLAKSHRAYMVVDNTFMSPYFQKPLDLGADIVVHSATKYLGGHSDVIGGALVTNDAEIHERMKFCQKSVGAVPGPFDCWLTLRGLKTLAIRMREHQSNATKIAQWLSEHPEVERVIYPGLPSHPQHDLAKRQMKNFSGMLSFQVGDTATAESIANAMIEKLQVIHYAVSLGHHRSLIFWMETEGLMKTSFRLTGSAEASYRAFAGDGIFRMSVGLEDAEDLIADLAQVL